MLKKLNAKALRSNLILSIALILIGAVILALSLPGIAGAAKGAEDAGTLHAPQMEGRYIEAEINFIWEPFAYVGDSEEDMEEVLYMVAIHPLESMDDFAAAEYIGLSVSGSLIKQTEALYERTNTAWESWDAADLGESVVIRGVVEAMDSEEQDFFEDLLVESGMEEANALPLILRAGTVPGGQTGFGSVVMTLFGAALLVWAAVLLVRTFSGYYQKDIRSFCAAAADPAYAMAGLEEFYAAAEPLPGDIRIDAHRLLLIDNLHARLLDPAGVIWVYTDAIRRRVNGIPVGTAYVTVLVDATGRRYRVTMRSKAEAEAAVDALFPLLPGAVFGYSRDYERMLKTDLSALAPLAAQQHAPQPEAELPPVPPVPVSAE